MYVLVKAQNGNDDPYSIDESRKWDFDGRSSHRCETDDYEIIPRRDDLLLRGVSIEETDNGECKMVRRFVINLSKGDLKKIADAARGIR